MMNKTFIQFVANHIRSGHLIMALPDGSKAVFGDRTGTPICARVTDPRTVRRLFLNPELAFGEAFMDGTFVLEEGSIYDFLELVFKNTRLDNLTGVPKLMRQSFGLFHRAQSYNSISKSKSNVAHHYDLNGDLYRLFLDEDSQYSCGYFETEHDSLDQAQLAKKRHLAAKMALNPGHQVLDIGSGWGGLGLYLAAHCGAQVTGITLSEEQHRIAKARAQAAGLEGHVRFDLKDYRDVSHRFDRIVSVGMFEHVGLAAYDDFFGKVHDLLADDGVMLLHYIGQTGTPTYTNPWILKYIFPGGYMPALSEVLPAIERNGLIATDIEVLRLHYAQTLRHWRKNFLARREEAVALYDERFARMWEFYLASSETAFRYRGLVIHQIQLTRRQEAVPLTRDYIERAEKDLRKKETLRQSENMATPPRNVKETA